MRCLQGWLYVVVLVALAIAGVGCGSPMKNVRPTGMPSGAVYGISGVEALGMRIPIVALRDISSRGVGKYAVTANESAAFAVAEAVARRDGTVLIAKGTLVAAKIIRKEHT